jgi:putative addiction module component (TIGR02574 family)
MAMSTIPFESLSAEERIKLIGQLWDSLDPTAAAPISPGLAAELDRREAEAEANPAAGMTWPEIKADLQDKLR